MEDIKNNAESSLLKKKNVVGVGLGQKWIKGQNTGEDAILVFVSRKMDKRALSKDDLIPDTIDGAKTDVVGRSGTFKVQGVYTNRMRPLQPGYSVSHPRVTVGTMGAVFRDFNNEVVILSNSHVLANSGRRVRRGDPIYQPGTYDGGAGGDTVGKLKYHRGLATQWGRAWNNADRHHVYGYNFEDSAVMSINDGIDYNHEIPVVGYVQDFREELLTVGENLQKSGRTTGYTRAKVIATSMTVNVDYGFAVLQFRDQIATDAMSSGGDSGSVTLDMNNNAVGLLFAGSSTVTLHNRIRYPRASYGLQIIPGTNIVTSYDYQLIVDGQTTEQSYNINDYDVAMQDVRQLALDGKTASIALTYQAQPE